MESINNYRILSTLGKGSFATVYLAKNTQDDEHYALKKVPPPSFRFNLRMHPRNKKEMLSTKSNCWALWRANT